MTSASTPVPPPQPTPDGPRGNCYRLVVPNSACAPRIARDFVGSLLHINDHPALADDARLCVTEVVTNSHRHTDSWRIQVDVTVRQRDVTVYVKDDKPYALPVPGNSDTEQEHGRGLLLLENLAAQWGSMVYGGRAPVAKTVWFTLAETRAGAEGSAGTGSGAGA